MNTFGEILIANAMSYHDKTAFVFENQRFTFSEVNQRVNSLINALSNMGVKKGDHVGILAYNCPQYFEAFALSKAGPGLRASEFQVRGKGTCLSDQ